MTKVTFILQDGGIVDEDGLANMLITDPSGPAVRIPVVTPTTISTRALL
ncbi:MAG: choice-of-anchor U domain-containing protein [Bacteroidota bacterium]